MNIRDDAVLETKLDFFTKARALLIESRVQVSTDIDENLRYISNAVSSYMSSLYIEDKLKVDIVIRDREFTVNVELDPTKLNGSTVIKDKLVLKHPIAKLSFSYPYGLVDLKEEQLLVIIHSVRNKVKWFRDNCIDKDCLTTPVSPPVVDIRPINKFK